MPTANSPQPPDATAIREALQALLALIADAVALRLVAKNNPTTQTADEQAPSTTAS